MQLPLPLLLMGALLAGALTPAASQLSTTATTTDESYRTPNDFICSDRQLKTLCRIIDAAGSGEGAAALKSGTTVETVFAPTDDAFDKDSKSVAGKLKLKDFGDIYTTPTAADRLLRSLIVPNQAVLSAAFNKDTEYPNQLKQQLEYETAWLTSQVYIKGSRRAEITRKDIQAGQAVIHVVNRVPFP